MTAAEDREGDGRDPGGMLAQVRDSPAQWEEALALAAGVESAWSTPPRAAVVCGMGGSGIAGDIAAVVAAAEGAVPVVAVKGDRLPRWVGPDSLVVAVSHSGETEETLACAAQARDLGARLTGVTSGGALAGMLEEERAPSVRIPGHLQPRASLAYLAVPTLALLEAAGVLAGVVATAGRVPDHLAARRREWERGARGAPAAMAARLADPTPWFVGGRGVASLVAHRGRCQMNENAERVAFAGELPELTHNTVVAWAGRRGLPGPTVLVAVTDPAGDARIGRRLAVTREVTGGAFVAHEDIELVGDTPLERLAAGVLHVDLLSVHVALADGTDPTPVAAITELKSRLTEEQRR